jgi:hypothetical protein
LSSVDDVHVRPAPRPIDRATPRAACIVARVSRRAVRRWRAGSSPKDFLSRSIVATSPLADRAQWRDARANPHEFEAF